MPPWTIVLASTAAAIAAAAALAIPQVAASPRSEIGIALLSQLPALAVAAFGIYGLVALSLTTTRLAAGVIRGRRHLADAEFNRALTRHDWIAMLVGDGFRPRAARVPEGPETADDNATAYTDFTVKEAREEIARRHYIYLARAHFFSVLVVLVGIVGLGAAQELGTLPFRIATIPTISAILIVVGLLLLALLAHVAVDVAAEPLLETIAQSAAEPVEAGLLRRIVAMQELARNGAAGSEGINHLPDRFPEQMAAAFEHGYRPLLDVAGSLSENSRALEAALRSAIEAIAARATDLSTTNYQLSAHFRICKPPLRS